MSEASVIYWAYVFQYLSVCIAVIIALAVVVIIIFIVTTREDTVKEHSRIILISFVILIISILAQVFVPTKETFLEMHDQSVEKGAENG